MLCGPGASPAGGSWPRRCSSALAFPAISRVLAVLADHSSYRAFAASRRLVCAASAVASDLALSARTWSCSASASADCCQASASACAVMRSWLLTSRGAVACARSPSSTRASSSPRVMARISACSSAISRARTRVPAQGFELGLGMRVEAHRLLRVGDPPRFPVRRGRARPPTRSLPAGQGRRPGRAVPRGAGSATARGSRAPARRVPGAGHRARRPARAPAPGRSPVSAAPTSRRVRCAGSCRR